tara:strand:+ start:10557 stop:12440 length:1884 start_codon:yes stop_codon:yes gene_type:complete
MATYYKYKSREGKDQIDWRGITKGITDDITRIAGEREEQRQQIDKDVLTNLETIADKPQGAYTKENERIANYAEQASAIALENQKLLKSGAITLKEYTARTNTAGSSTKKLFTLSKQYQANYEEGMQRLQSVDGKPPVGSEIEAMLMGSVERFGPPGSTDYYIDPVTGEAFLASTIEEGDPNSYKNTKEIGGVNKALMSVGTAEGIINRKVDRYQSDAEATRLADALGTEIKVLQDKYPNIKTKEDAFARMFDAEGELSDFGKAVNKSIEASMVTDMSKASMLIDTMGADGYFMYAKNEDGSFTNIATNERMDKIEDADKAIEMFVDNSGAYQPRLSEAQEKAAIDGVRDMMRTKLDIKETAGETDSVRRARLAQERKNNQSTRNKGAKDNTAVTNLAKLFYGSEQDAGAAANFIRGLSGNEDLRIELQGDNMIIQRVKEDGTLETTGEISKQGGLKNFIESSVTLLGIDINNIQDALSRSGVLKDRDGKEFQPNLISLISQTTTQKVPSTVDEITTMINKDVNDIQITAQQAKDEEDLAEILSSALGKYNVQVTEETFGSDAIGLKLPTGELLTVDLKEATPEDIKETIKTLILGDINKDTLIKYKGKLESGGGQQGSDTGGNVRK